MPDNSKQDMSLPREYLARSIEGIDEQLNSIDREMAHYKESLEECARRMADLEGQKAQILAAIEALTPAPVVDDVQVEPEIIRPA